MKIRRKATDVFFIKQENLKYFNFRVLKRVNKISISSALYNYVPAPTDLNVLCILSHTGVTLNP